MRKAWLVAKKDLYVYFRSPLAYVLMAVYLFITGFLFFRYLIIQYHNYSVQYSRMAGLMAGQPPTYTLQELVIWPYLVNCAATLLFFLPLLTMRSVSEEKKLGTLDLLVSYPLRESTIAAGKLLALSVLLITVLVLAMVGPLLIFFFAGPEPLPMLTGFAGLFLMSVGFASMGLFFSTLTENQAVSAFLTFAAGLALWMMTWIKDLVSGPASRIIEHLSLLDHLEPFAKGVLDLAGLVYFLAVIGTFYGLCVFSLEYRRWRA